MTPIKQEIYQIHEQLETKHIPDCYDMDGHPMYEHINEDELEMLLRVTMLIELSHLKEHVNFMTSADSIESMYQEQHGQNMAFGTCPCPGVYYPMEG